MYICVCLCVYTYTYTENSINTIFRYFAVQNLRYILNSQRFTYMVCFSMYLSCIIF